MVLFICGKSNPINGLVRLVFNMKRPSKTSSYDALCVSKCPFATIF